MNHNLIRLIIVLFFLFSLLGCAGKESAIDKNFGFNSQLTFKRQIIFPDQSVSEIIPAKMEGITAERTMATFNDSYGEQPEVENLIEE